MKTETVEIPATVLASVETLDELQDWLTAQHPKLIAELRAARKQTWPASSNLGNPATCPVDALVDRV